MDINHDILPEKLYACWYLVPYSKWIKANAPFGTFPLDEPDTVLQEFEQVIFDQDKRIFES